MNLPASITTKVDRFFNKFSKQQAGGQVCYSDHASISGGAFVRQVPTNVLDRIVNDFEPYSPTGQVYTFVLVDFLKVTFFIDNLGELNIMNSETPVIFDEVIRTFGIDRVMQHFNVDTTAPMYVLHKRRLQEVVSGLCRTLEQACKRVNRPPYNSSDYLCHFVWQDQDALTSTDSPAMDIIRLSRANNHSPLLLEAKSSPRRATRARAGARAGFVPIGVSQLVGKLSTRGAADLLLRVLCNPHLEFQVPAGGHDDHPGPRDCLKQAILAAPDVILSPTGKLRVDETFSSDRETSIETARSLLSSKVKTIRLKEIKRNVHTHAMNSNDVMVGVFHDGPLKHCVLIDGRNEPGCITDPAIGKKEVVRSSRTLKKLGISEFRHLFVFKRVELSKRNRARSAKKLGLPFLPSEP